MCILQKKCRNHRIILVDLLRIKICILLHNIFSTLLISNSNFGFEFKYTFSHWGYRTWISCSSSQQLAMISTECFEHFGDSNEFYTQIFQATLMSPVRTKHVSVDILYNHNICSGFGSLLFGLSLALKPYKNDWSVNIKYTALW